MVRSSGRQVGTCVGLVLTLLSTISAAEITSGVSFSQVDFTFVNAPEVNSEYGLAVVNYNQFATSGYINIETAAGWVVQNLPVFHGSGLPGLSVMFDLGFSGTQTAPFLADVDFSQTPLANNSSLTAPPSTYGTLTHVQNNDEGTGPALTAAPGSPAGGKESVTFNAAGQTTVPVINTIAGSVEQDMNQCGPGAVANSLAYLNQRYGVTLKQQNIPGIAGVPPNSLVGQIDTFVPRAQGQGVWRGDLLDGKLKYLNANGPKGLSLEYQGSFDYANGTFVGATDTQGQTTAISKGNLVTIDYLMKEIAAGEDVEMDISFDGSVRGAGHEIMITGGGFILGRPYVTFVHDANQGNNASGTGLLDGGYGFAWLDDPGNGGFIQFKGYVIGANGVAGGVRNVITESVPEPSGFVLAGVALAAMLVRRRCLRMA
jgi:hypothetical protein